MKILITGSSGLIGKALIDNLKEDIVKFDLRKGLDLRNYYHVKKYVNQVDLVIHLGGLIPPKALINQEDTIEINYYGTQNIVRAIKESDKAIKLIFASSVSVFGYTQELNRLVNMTDPVFKIDFYTESKILAENYIKDNLSDFLILRLTGVLSADHKYSLDLLKESFKMPPYAKAEFILDKDVATAFQHAIINFRNVKGKTLIIGGGQSMQIRTRELIVRMFEAIGIQAPSEACYEQDMNKYYLNWYNTDLSQSLLMYQNHSFEEYIELLEQKKQVPKFLSKLIGHIIENMSPYR